MSDQSNLMRKSVKKNLNSASKWKIIYSISCFTEIQRDFCVMISKDLENAKKREEGRFNRNVQNYEFI